MEDHMATSIAEHIDYSITEPLGMELHVLPSHEVSQLSQQLEGLSFGVFSSVHAS